MVGVLTYLASVGCADHSQKQELGLGLGDSQQVFVLGLLCWGGRIGRGRRGRHFGGSVVMIVRAEESVFVSLDKILCGFFVRGGREECKEERRW